MRKVSPGHDGQLMNDAGLLDLLRDCYTPQGRNLVEAGLVRSATLTADADAPGAGIAGVPGRYIAHVTVHAPSRDESASAQLRAQIENRLLGVASISRTDVSMLPPLFAIL